MKILFIGSGCACRLPFVEYLFKKKIQEAEVPDIEVESADMAMWGVTSNESGIPESSGPDKVGNLLNQADFIVVMEGRQRNFLTRFMDYSSWNKIHLFLDYCTSGKEHLVGSVCGDLDYQTQDESDSSHKSLFEGAFRRENGNLHVDNGLNDKAYRAGTFMLGMLYD